MNAPLTFSWDGEAMYPVGRARTECDQRFVVGMRYVFEQVEDEVSSANRAQFFATVRDAWATLPERLADRFPSAESLRKHALVASGFCDDRKIVCATKAEAQRWARNLTMLPGYEYAVIVAKDTIVLVRTPKSQKARHMKKAEFNDSRDGVMREIAKLLDTPQTDLEQTVGRAA